MVRIKNFCSFRYFLLILHKIKTMRTKKFYLSTLIGCVLNSLLAQNIGINPTGAAPDNSAGLDVNFTNKGLLIPRVALTSALDNVTIPSPANSLLVYNTGTGGLTPAGYYYNAGTPGTPNWVQLLPSTAALSGSGVATRVAFWTGATTLGSNANLYWDNVNSRLGVGTSTPANRLGVRGGNIGWGNTSEVNLLQNDQGGSIELGGTNSLANPISNGKPYIDFHFGTGSAQDFNTRIINAANNRLDFVTNSGGTIMSVNGSNVGIGTTSPSQKLDVSGNVQFSGALMPGGNAGTSGQVLRSQGPGIAPVWFPMAASIVYQNAFNSTGSVCINSTSWTTHPGCSVPIPLQAGDVVWAWGYGSAMADNNCDGSSDLVSCFYNVRIAVNGADFPDGAWARGSVDNQYGIVIFDAYSIAGRFIAPSSGSYTFELQTSRAGGSGNAITAGNNTSALQSGMMIIVYRP